MENNTHLLELKEINMLLRAHKEDLVRENSTLESQISLITNARAYSAWQGLNLIKRGLRKVSRDKKSIIFLIFKDRLLLNIKLHYYSAYFRRISMPILMFLRDKRTTDNKIDIIIPWYGDAHVYPLLEKLYEVKNRWHKVIIVNDNYPSEEANKKLYETINEKYTKQVKYLVTKTNKGFPHAVNVGIKESKNDVIVMNSDTLPIGNWLEEMRLVAGSDDNIATVTAMSNNATIFSLPLMNQKNPAINAERTATILGRLSPQPTIDVPTAHGFCMLLKRGYINKYGLLDEITYGKGYCEENDLSMVYMKAGLRNVASTKAFVLHFESQSFGLAKQKEQIANNYQKLLSKHPEYDDLVHKKFIPKNPFSFLRDLVNSFGKDVELLEHEWTLVVIHKNPFKIIGGVEREVLKIVKMSKQRREMENIIIYFYEEENNQAEVCLIKSSIVRHIFTFPTATQSLDIFNWILTAFRVKNVIIEHLFNHSLLYGKKARDLSVPVMLFVHDYYYLSQIPDLVNKDGHFIGMNPSKDMENRFTEEMYGKKYMDRDKWRRLCRDLFEKYANSVIFNSELTKETYFRILDLTENEKYIISYPDVNI